MKILDLLLQNKRPLLMLVSMTCGILFYKPLAVVDTSTNHIIVPMLIFLMLFVSFCSVRLRDLKITWMQVSMALFQIIVSPLSYYIFLPFGELIAQGAMVCFLAPIAMAAVAVGSLLGGNATSITTYTLVCNLVIAFVAPYYLDIFGNGECTFLQILWRVAPLLIMPMAAAQLLKFVWHRAADWIGSRSIMAFYMWLLTMLVTLGRTTDFVMDVRDDISLSTGFGLVGIALFACALQFFLGRKLGNYFGESVAGTQSLGQKNTALTVWLAQSFLTPASSIAPTAYIIWQNLANSYQLFRHDRKQRL